MPASSAGPLAHREVLAAIQASHADIVAKVTTLEELVRSEGQRTQLELQERMGSMELMLRSGCLRPSSAPQSRRNSPSPPPPPLPGAGKPRGSSKGHAGAASDGKERETAAAEGFAKRGWLEESRAKASQAFTEAAGFSTTALEAQAPECSRDGGAADDRMAILDPAREARAVLAKVEKHPAFEVVSAIVSIGNAIALGVQTDIALRDKMAGSGGSSGWLPPARFDGVVFVAINLFFASWVFAELCLRNFVQPERLFVQPQLKYTVLDAVVIMSALAEVVLYQFGLSFLRVLQLARLVRVARSVVGVQRIRGIQRMLSTALRSLFSLFWAVCLLFVIAWVAAMLLLQAVTLHYPALDQTRVSPISWSAAATDAEVFELLFGSVAKATYTLFAVITGGLNWLEAAEPLINMNPFYSWFFLVYVSLVALGMLNVMTAFFVDQALQAAQRDNRKTMRDQLETLRPLLRGAKGAAGTEGALSARALESALSSPAAEEILSKGDLSAQEAVALHKLLCMSGEGVVSEEEFISGYVQMAHGNASALALLYEGRRSGIHLEALGKEQQKHADRTRAAIKRVESLLSKHPDAAAAARNRSGTRSPRSPMTPRSVKSSARSVRSAPKCDQLQDVAPPLSRAQFSTCLSVPAKAGHWVLHVRSAEGLAKGLQVEIAGDGYSEKRTLKSLTPVTLDSPLKLAYPAGATVTSAAPDLQGTAAYHFDDCGRMPHDVYRAVTPVKVNIAGRAGEAKRAPVIPKLELSQISQGTRVWPPHLSGTTAPSSASVSEDDDSSMPSARLCDELPPLPPRPDAVSSAAASSAASSDEPPQPPRASRATFAADRDDGAGRSTSLQRKGTKINQQGGPPKMGPRGQSWKSLNKMPSVVER